MKIDFKIHVCTTYTAVGKYYAECAESNNVCISKGRRYEKPNFTKKKNNVFERILRPARRFVGGGGQRCKVSPRIQQKYHVGTYIVSKRQRKIFPQTAGTQYYALIHTIVRAVNDIYIYSCIYSGQYFKNIILYCYCAAWWKHVKRFPRDRARGGGEDGRCAYMGGCRKLKRFTPKISGRATADNGFWKIYIYIYVYGVVFESPKISVIIKTIEYIM